VPYNYIVVEYLPYIIITFAALVFLGLVLSLILRRDNSEPKRKKKKIKSKDRNRIIREANKRLIQNPKDHEALMALADLYFKEGIYDKAMNYYRTLIELCATNLDVNEFEVTLRFGLAAFKLQEYDEAYKSLVIAFTMNEDNFELCYNLGYLEYLKKDYEKALAFFRRAQRLDPEHVQTIRFLGHSYFRNRQYTEAGEELRKAIEFEPNDKESLFALAQCHYELGHTDQALTIFSHLRLDPKLGPNAALFSGTIHLKSYSYQKAIMDLEIGLKHKNIPQEIQLELKYRLAIAYLKDGNMKRALELLENIREVKPDYKDVLSQIDQYRELMSNKDLQTFLMAPKSEFLTLCRKIAANFFEDSKAKLLNIALNKNDYAEILAEIHTKRWEDVVLFRFIRTTGTIGELVIRDFYTSCRDHKADRGFCITAGDFSDSAKQFTEARLIDLIDKKGIVALFRKLNRAPG
jgi:tetratricopeptide (TPR) repeat protein